MEAAGMGEVFRILKEGGALGGLALALVAVVYLFKKLHDVWEKQATEATAKADRLTLALEEEKDEHRQTAMSIVGLSQDLARLLEKQNERRSHGARRTSPVSGGGVGSGGGGGTTSSPTGTGGPDNARAEDVRGCSPDGSAMPGGCRE